MLITHVCTKNLKISTTLVVFDPFLAKLAAAEHAHFGPKIQSQSNPTKISDQAQLLSEIKNTWLIFGKNNQMGL